MIEAFIYWMMGVHPAVWFSSVFFVEASIVVLVLSIQHLRGASVSTTAASRLRDVHKSNGGFVLAMFVALNSVFEETVRIAPVAASVYLFGSGWVTAIVLVSTSIVFGVAHMANGIALWIVLSSQAVGGLAYSLTYLKFGGLDGDIMSGYAVACACHIAWNAMVLSLGWGAISKREPAFTVKVVE